MSLTVTNKIDIFGRSKLFESLNVSTTRYQNTIVGASCPMLHDGSRNTFLGHAACGNGNVGDQNVFVGIEAGAMNAASWSTFVGAYSGFYNVNGKENVGVGIWSGGQNSNGCRNTCIGSFAGRSIEGSDNIFVGYSNGLLSKSCSNVIAIGKLTDPRNNDHVVIGNSSKALGEGSVILGGDVYDSGAKNIILANNCGLRNSGSNNFIVMTPSDGPYNNSVGAVGGILHDTVNIKNRFLSTKVGGVTTTTVAGDVVQLKSSKLSLSGGADFKGPVAFSSSLSVGGSASIGSNLEVAKTLKVNERSYLNGGADVSGDLSVTGNISGGSNLRITAQASVGGALQVQGPISTDSNLIVQGSSVFVGPADFSSNVIISKDLAIHGDFSVDSNVHFRGSLDFSGPAEFNSNVSIRKDVDIGGNLAIDSNLLVYGTSAFKDVSRFYSNVVIDTNVDIGGNLGIDSNLLVYGSTHLFGDISVVSNAYFNSNVFVGGDLSACNVRVGKLVVDDIQTSAGCNLFLNPSSSNNLSGVSTLLNCTLYGTTTVQGPLVLQTIDSTHLSIFGSVDMLDGPVHIKDLVVDKITFAGLSNCFCGQGPSILEPPVQLPSDPMFSMNEIIGDLLVDGYICAKKGYCCMANFFAGIQVLGGTSLFTTPVQMQTLEVQDIRILGNISWGPSASNVNLPPPNEYSARFDGDVVIDGNIYVAGDIGVGPSNLSLTSGGGQKYQSSSSGSSSLSSGGISTTTVTTLLSDIVLQKPDSSSLQSDLAWNTLRCAMMLPSGGGAGWSSGGMDAGMLVMLVQSQVDSSELIVAQTQTANEPRVVGIYVRTEQAQYNTSLGFVDVSTASLGTGSFAVVQNRGCGSILVCPENRDIQAGNL